MCRLAGVSRASFYRHWEKQAPGAAEMAFRDALQRVALADRYCGYRRIQVRLGEQGLVVGAKKIRRWMREDNLLAIRRRKFVVTTDARHGFQVYPNLAQHLELTDINQLWVADLTYVRLQQEFVYLAVVLDAYSRRVIGWALERSLQSFLAVKALEKAIAARQPQPGLVHHSDRGSQYASQEYVQRLQACGAVLSMSRPGRPWENGRCESFIKTLKHEELDARPYASLEQLRQQVAEFIERIYNPVRLHSALGYRSPIQFENQMPSIHGGAGASPWRPAIMSFPRHEEIYSDGSNPKPGSEI
jgi:putative transposase